MEVLYLVVVCASGGMWGRARAKKCNTSLALVVALSSVNTQVDTDTTAHWTLTVSDGLISRDLTLTLSGVVTLSSL